MPARYLFMDEIDAYPGDVGGEGDPILLAERRSATFRLRRKIFMVSTPTVKGISRVQREFEKSDQRYFFVPCTSCGHYQHLRFTQLRWPEGEPEDAKYACESCGQGYRTLTATLEDPAVVDAARELGQTLQSAQVGMVTMLSNGG